MRKHAPGSTEEIAVDGAFVAIGHKPNTEFLKGHVRLAR
jgi:thioredoxin reductase